MPYTTYLDWHGAPMLVDPQTTAHRAHALRRHWIRLNINRKLWWLN